MGQAVLDLLSMIENQAWLGGAPPGSPIFVNQGYGIGNYTSAGEGGQITARLGTTLGTNNRTVASIAVGLAGVGSGYSSTTPPNILIAGPCTTQATATATVTGTSVNFPITPTSAGSGYSRSAGRHHLESAALHDQRLPGALRNQPIQPGVCRGANSQLS